MIVSYWAYTPDSNQINFRYRLKIEEASLEENLKKLNLDNPSIVRVKEIKEFSSKILNTATHIARFDFCEELWVGGKSGHWENIEKFI